MKYHAIFLLCFHLFMDWTCHGVDSSQHDANNQATENIYPHLHRNNTNIEPSVLLSDKKQKFDKCFLYLAPSSIPHSGFGIYTTRDIAKNEYINQYLDSPTIAIVDKGKYFRTHRNYVWGSNLFTQYEAENVSVAVPSWSSYCNFHTYLYNFKHDKGFYNDSMVSRFTDPSAGSFSYHQGFYYKATRNIKAGEEVFANYGEAWLDYREGTYADQVPREEDIKTGGKILNKLLQFKNVEKNSIEDLDLSRIQSIVKVMNERVASILPVTTAELSNLEEIKYPADLEPMAARLATSTIKHTQQNLDWIYENGLCMDNVRAEPSTIPLAGYGAFAARFLSKGELITPSPLLHVMEPYENISNQLLVNYCFGHERSSILLCPMSALVLMNHCSRRMQHSEGACDPANGPNAEVRWATDWYPSNKRWLNMTLSELHEMYMSEKSGLAFDVIALRDIQADEEIFIDYGKKWEEAWDRHVKSWVPLEKDDTSYQSISSILEREYEPRTVEDLKNEPYPQNIIQVCFFDINIADTYGSSGAGYDLIVEDGSIFTPVNPLIYEDYVYQCDMLRKNNDGTCTVVVVPSLDNEYTVLIKKYPLAGITFRQKPYSSDMHLNTAFRHYISISDDILPQRWSLNQTLSNDVSLVTNECSLYLAPSSIPDAGYGVYTTRLIMPGQSIVTEDAPIIIVSDSTAHNKGENVVWSVIDYAWTGSANDMILSFNIGALANYHTVLSNMKPHAVSDGPHDYSSSVDDPSHGAYTIERGYDFVATKAIFPGEEIFADYGESWLDTRPDSFADHIPRFIHYNHAVAVLKTMKNDSDVGKFPLNESTYSLVFNTVKSLNSLVAQTLPRTVSEMQENIATDDSDMIRNKLAKRSITVAQHTVEWVKENGLCIDNITPGMSTVSHAGKGAFATRFLAKGSIISPAPLVQIPDLKSLFMYELIKRDDRKRIFRKDDNPIGSQLLLNYCFTHKDSELLLYPLTNVILINHCSSRMAFDGHCSLQGPNAKVQWAGSWESGNKEWLNKSLEEIYELTAVGMRGLSFDIIATRDISKGEEIFIDYGVDWENAWEEHIRNWEPPSSSDRGATIIPMKEGRVDIRTIQEQLKHPYPDHVVTMCYYDLELEWVNSTYRGGEYFTDGSIYQVSEGEIASSDDLYRCEILEKQEDEMFVVRILPLDGYVDTPVVLDHYPATSVLVRTQKQSSDLGHVSRSFRHPIVIDDDMWPSQWKNN